MSESAEEKPWTEAQCGRQSAGKGGASVTGQKRNSPDQESAARPQAPRHGCQIQRAAHQRAALESVVGWQVKRENVKRVSSVGDPGRDYSFHVSRFTSSRFNRSPLDRATGQARNEIFLKHEE